MIQGGHNEVTDESFLPFIVNGRDVWEWSTSGSGSVPSRVSSFVGNKVHLGGSRASPLIIKGELTVWETVMEEELLTSPVDVWIMFL
jgi:hypothetical protein